MSTSQRGPAGWIRPAAAAAVVGLLALGLAAPASAQKPCEDGDCEGGGGGKVGGGKIGEYKITSRALPKYESLSPNATWIFPPGQTRYYYEFGTIRVPDDFAFKFFGKPYTQIGVGLGGWANPGAGTNVYGDHALPNASAPSGIMAPWWGILGLDSLDSYRGGIRWEMNGEGENRTLSIEWYNMFHYYCYQSSGYETCDSAVHFTYKIVIGHAKADRDSLIQYHYAPLVNPNGRNSAYPSSWSDIPVSCTVGIESPDNALGMSLLPCANNCTQADFPANTIVQFGQGPDLISTVKGPLIGWTGVPASATVTVENVGARDAVGFGAKLYVSEDNKFDPSDTLMVMAPADLDEDFVNPGGLFTVHSEGTLDIPIRGPMPVDLDLEQYYLIADVDPARPDGTAQGLVEEDVETNNWSVYGPFAIGAPTADLAATDLVTESFSVEPGDFLRLSFDVHNVGNLGVVEVPYWIVLSVEDVITPSDTEIHSGTITIDALTQEQRLLEVQVPSDIRPGVYHVGVILDPTNNVFEIDDHNNVALAPEPVLAGSDGVQITSGQLGTGYVGAPYCTHLQAAGGNGVYTWEATNPARLPPGIALREEPADARTRGLPFDTLLCGTPAVKGEFTFEVKVTSFGKSATKTLAMDVEGEVPALTIVTRELPAATFQVGYEAALLATGGVPPYVWELDEDSELPPGISLLPDGRLNGMAELDGRYPIIVHVEDSAGATATQEMYVSVSPPGRLTCISQALKGARVGEEYTAQMFAAGGNKPYLWETVETRRLAEGVTDPGETTTVAPPGLVLAESGSVSGTPASSGSYLWTARVTDQAGQSDVCILSVDFNAGAMNVTTSALPLVCIDEPFSVQLDATGGDGGFLRWSLGDNSRLPDGLELTEQGVITGVVNEVVLEGNSSRTFNVTVYVRDSSNAKGVGAVALRVQKCAPREVKKTSGEDDGCGNNAAGGSPAFIGLAALALLGLRRRR